MRGPGPAGDGGGRRGPGLHTVDRWRGTAFLATGTCVAVLAVTLSACGGAGLALARQACVHVKTSLRLYAESQDDPDRRTAAADRLRAIEQLEVALPLAASATSDDPQWNPLMTTLQEIGRNSEANLVAALRAQCAQADTPNEQAPVIPSTVPGQPAPSSRSTLPGQ